MQVGIKTVPVVLCIEEKLSIARYNPADEVLNSRWEILKEKLAILPLSGTQIRQCYLTNHIEALVSEKEPDAPIGWNVVLLRG